jgi:hypothetical protein
VSQATNIKINIGDLKAKAKRKPRAKKIDKEKDGMSSFNTGSIPVAVPIFSQQMRPFNYTPPVFSKAEEPVKAVPSAPSIPVPVEPPPVASDMRPTPRRLSELTSYKVPVDRTPFVGAISAGFIPSEAPALSRPAFETMTGVELQRELKRYESAGSETSRASEKASKIENILSLRMQDIPNAPSAPSGGSVQQAIAKANEPEPVIVGGAIESQPSGGGGRTYKTTPEQREKARARYAKKRDEELARKIQMSELQQKAESVMTSRRVKFIKGSSSESGYKSNQ